MRYCPRCGSTSDSAVCPTDGTPTVRQVAHGRRRLETGDVIGGRYRVSGELGRGGFGVVFDTVHVTTGHAVAVKVLTPVGGGEGQEMSRRFFQEASTTSRLSHPNTVRVYDFGQTDNGDLFLAMERLDGETLASAISRHSNENTVMSEDQVVDTGIAVLRSLGEAHAHGLVHRDMKPANIFLHQMAGGDSIVKVLDFGIVKDTDSGMTQAGQALGTPTHMSPEQAMGKKVDGRADLYALGVVLYECLTGKLPFFGENPLSIVMQHVTEPVPPIEQRAPGLVRPALAAVVERALAKEPDARWQNAVDMRLALQQATGVPSESGMFRMPTIGPDGKPVFQSQIGQAPALAPRPSAIAPAAQPHAAAPNAGGPDQELVETPRFSPAAAQVAVPKAALRATIPQRPRPPSMKVYAEDVDAHVEGVQFAGDTMFVQAPIFNSVLNMPPPIPYEDAQLEEILEDEQDSGYEIGGAMLSDDDAEVDVPARNLAVPPPPTPVPVNSQWGETLGFGLPGRMPLPMRGTVGMSQQMGIGGDPRLAAMQQMLGDPRTLLQSMQQMSQPQAHRPRSQGPAIAAMWLTEDGRHALFAQPSGPIRLVDIGELGEHPLHLLDISTFAEVGEHHNLICAIAGTPDGRIALSGSVDGIVRAWDISAGKMVGQAELDSEITAIAVASDGKLAIVGCQDGGAHLLEMPNLAVRRVLRGHRDAITAVAAASSRRLVATAGDDGSVRTWDPVGGGARLTWRAHEGAVGGLAAAANGQAVASGGWDGKLQCWFTRTGEVATEIPGAHHDVIASVAIDRVGTFVATASDDRSAKVWRVASGELVAERRDFRAGAKGLRFLEDQLGLIVGCWDGSVRKVSW